MVPVRPGQARHHIHTALLRQQFCACLRVGADSNRVVGDRHDQHRQRTHRFQSWSSLGSGALAGSVRDVQRVRSVRSRRCRRSRRRRRKCPRPSGPTRSSAAGAWPRSRTRTTAPAPKRPRSGQCKNPYVIGAGSSGGVIMHLADQATPQELRLKGSPERQELYRSGRSRRRRAGPRNRLVRRPRAGDPVPRQGRRHPLRQHGLCPLRAAGMSPAAICSV